MSKFKVDTYKKSDGVEPVSDFILGQHAKMQAKILRTIELLEDYGNTLGEPHSKHLDDGICELRVKVSTDITRVLYFFCVDKKIILTNGFVKKTDKTPHSEIKLAKKYRDDYLTREGK